MRTLNTRSAFWPWAGWAASRLVALAAAAALAAVVVPSHAQTFTFSGSGASKQSTATIAAQATFQVSGTDLLITLTNTAGTPTTVNGDVLTGLFFDAPGMTGLTAGSVTLGPGSSYLPPGYTVDSLGKYWSFENRVTTPGLPYFGLGAAGYNGFNASNAFDPASSGNDLDGVNYGLLSQLTTALPAGGQSPFIKNEADFVLHGWTGGPLTSASVSNVLFTYGSSLGLNQFPGTPGGGSGPGPGVPEPGLMAFLGAGILGSLSVMRRRRHI